MNPRLERKERERVSTRRSLTAWRGEEPRYPRDVSHARSVLTHLQTVNGERSLHLSWESSRLSARLHACRLNAHFGMATHSRRRGGGAAGARSAEFSRLPSARCSAGSGWSHRPTCRQQQELRHRSAARRRSRRCVPLCPKCTDSPSPALSPPRSHPRVPPMPCEHDYRRAFPS